MNRAARNLWESVLGTLMAPVQFVPPYSSSVKCGSQDGWRARVRIPVRGRRSSRLCPSSGNDSHEMAVGGNSGGIPGTQGNSGDTGEFRGHTTYLRSFRVMGLGPGFRRCKIRPTSRSSRSAARPNARWVLDCRCPCPHALPLPSSVVTRTKIARKGKDVNSCLSRGTNDAPHRHGEHRERLDCVTITTVKVGLNMPQEKIAGA